MADNEIDYSTFQPDWWDAAGATTEAIKTEIAILVDSTFGTGGLPAIQKAAIEQATFAQYEAQQAIKAAAAAAAKAASYADIPDSVLYKDAVASRIAYENIAKNYINESAQVIKNAGADAALVSKLLKAAAVLGPAINIAQLGAAAATGDAYVVAQKAVGVLAGMAFGALVVGAATLAGAPLLLTGAVAIVVGFAAGKGWEWMWDHGAAEFYGINKGDKFNFDTIIGAIDIVVSNLFGIARAWFQRKDPLTLDLDGDGIKNATGWIKPDDGFLVFDRNGNGTIDDGTELFGDSTPILDAAGNQIRKAEDGFDALAQEDTNGDGIVNASDARWSELRIWQDTNQDAISDPGELKTMDEAGIAGIIVAKTENSQPLANGNLIADLGNFIRADGSAGGIGAVTAQMGDIDLAENTFYSEFADTIPLTEAAQLLPELEGSGRVRDLREAASLTTIQGQALADLTSLYAAATTRSQQLALLDQILIAWGKTSDLAVTGAGAYGGLPTTVSVDGVAKDGPAYEVWMTRLQTLERFNGRPFAKPAANATSVSIELFGERQTLLNQAWSALRQSVYDGLLLQTRLKPYVNDIGLAISYSGFGMDFSNADAAFQARYEQAPPEAVRDLLDLQRIVGTNLTGLGWDGYGQLRGWLSDAATNPNHDEATRTALMGAIVAGIGDFGYPGLRLDGAGTSASEVVTGNDAGATLNGNGGNDIVLGGAGDDTLNGGSGSDVLHGGAGNDTYVFKLGDGQDTIVESSGDTGQDVIVFGAGIRAGDLDIYLDGDKLVLRHINGSDKVTIANWFDSLSDGAHRLDSLRFADGATLTLDGLQLGSAGNEFVKSRRWRDGECVNGGWRMAA